jgi:hypothetical protein
MTEKGEMKIDVRLLRKAQVDIFAAAFTLLVFIAICITLYSAGLNNDQQINAIIDKIVLILYPLTFFIMNEVSMSILMVIISLFINIGIYSGVLSLLLSKNIFDKNYYKPFNITYLTYSAILIFLILLVLRGIYLSP